MTKRTRNILVAVVVFLLIAFLLLLLLRPEAKEQVPTQPFVAPATEEGIRTTPMVAPISVRAEPTPNQVSAETIARTFAERYGSFSAESNFANVRDLFPVMTSSFRVAQEAQIASATVGEEYYGVSSRVISMSTTEMTEGSATVEINMQRTESIGSPNSTSTKTETLRLELLNLNGNWLVNDAEWI